MNPQKRITINLGSRSSDKGFSCIDFHPQGKISVRNGVEICENRVYCCRNNYG